MGREAEKWLESVDRHFGFLTGLGFGTREVDDSSFWSTWVQYRSETAAVRISKSNEFVRAEVSLIRLVKGQVPPYPIWITDDRIDWMLLDNIVELKQPDLMKEVKKQSGLKPVELDRQLHFWALVLRRLAGDFLAGDFRSLDEAASIIRDRVADNPQEVTVWLPEDAPDEVEAQHVEELAAILPPVVGVSVRRYRRPTPR